MFLSVWGLVEREVCFRLNPRVLFSGDFIGESGDEAYLSLISLRISAAISLLALAMFAGFGIRCGFLGQLRALGVRAVF